VSPVAGTVLGRYRVMAYVVGIILLVLVFVAVPLKFFAHHPGPAMVVGQLHGFLYIVYLVLALNLAVQRRWSLPRTVLLLLAGTVPFLTFVMERRVATWVAARSQG